VLLGLSFGPMMMSHPCVGEYAFGYITSTMVLQVLVHAYLHAVDGF